MVAVTLSTSLLASVKADILVVGLRADADPGVFADALTAVGFSGDKGASATLPLGDDFKARAAVVLALPAEPTNEDLRRAAARGVRAAEGLKGTTAAIAFGPEDAAAVAAISEGVHLGAYRFESYKSAPKDKPRTRLKSVTVLTPLARKGPTTSAVKAAAIVTESVAQARDWVNTPPADLRPPAFADAIAAYAGEFVTVKVWDEKRLAKERCGGILGVGQGSSVGPRLVTLTYSPSKPVAHLALVGKGITFDSGGLSIKTGPGMSTMKIDMGGAAAVVAATVAIARLGLKVKVTAFAALAENMPSGQALRPGDVLTARNGSTIEVLNTDAEGRLVLADALSLAAELKPDHIVDVATLTGAAMIALGERTTGVLGNDEDLIQQVLDAASVTAEPMWPLPIPEEIAEAVKSSSIADLRQHNPKPYGGTLYAASFLGEFVNGQSWAHLDIAGPAFNDGAARDHTPTGGTGTPVRTLVELARALSS